MSAKDELILAIARMSAKLDSSTEEGRAVEAAIRADLASASRRIDAHIRLREARERSRESWNQLADIANRIGLGPCSGDMLRAEWIDFCETAVDKIEADRELS